MFIIQSLIPGLSIENCSIGFKSVFAYNRFHNV